MPLVAPRFAKNPRLQAAANNAPAMAIGETSAGVRDLQQALIDLGYAMPRSTRGGFSPPDGIFGSETRSVVMQFQKDQKLYVDGVAGKETLTRLDNIFAAGDPDYVEPLGGRLSLLQEMNGPPGKRPFAVTTARKNTAKG